MSRHSHNEFQKVLAMNDRKYAILFALWSSESARGTHRPYTLRNSNCTVVLYSVSRESCVSSSITLMFPTIVRFVRYRTCCRGFDTPHSRFEIPPHTVDSSHVSLDFHQLAKNFRRWHLLCVQKSCQSTNLLFGPLL